MAWDTRLTASGGCVAWGIPRLVLAHGLGGYPQSARRKLRLRVVPAACARGIPEVCASAWSGGLPAECAARCLGVDPQSARGEHPHAVHGAWSGGLPAGGAAPGLGGYPQGALARCLGVDPQSAQARGLGGYPKSARCRDGWRKEVMQGGNVKPDAMTPKMATSGSRGDGSTRYLRGCSVGRDAPGLGGYPQRARRVTWGCNPAGRAGATYGGAP